MRDSGDERAALIASAQLLRQWVRGQRATWADLETDLTRIGGPVRPPAHLTVTPPAPLASVAATPLAPPPVTVAPAAVFTPPAPAVMPQEDERPVLQLSGDDDDSDTTADPAVDRWTLPLPRLQEFPSDESAAEAEAVAPDVTFLLDTQAIADVPRVRTGAPTWFWKAAAVFAVVGVLGTTGYVARSTLSQRKAAPDTGTAVLESTETAAVFVDGAQQGDTPLKLELTPGKHAVEFRRNGATRTMSVEIAAGASVVARADWAAKRFGALEIASMPTGAKVTVDGKDRGLTPLTLTDVAVGSHAVLLQSGDGSIKRTVTVSEDKTTRVNEDIFAGFIHVSAGLVVQMSEGKRAITLDNRNQALLSPGLHQIRFVNRTFGYDEMRTVEIKPGAIAEITIEAPTSRLSVTATVGGEVFVDGERAGELPLTDFPVKVGTREVVVKSAEGERRMTRTITTAPLHLEFDFSAP